MSWDDADRPRLAQAGVVDEARAQRLMARVMTALPECGEPLSLRLARWLMGAMPRFGMPMATAALLGVVVGRYLQAAEDAAAMADLLTYTSWLSTGL